MDKCIVYHGGPMIEVEGKLTAMGTTICMGYGPI